MIYLAGRLLQLNNNIIIGSGKEYHKLFRDELPGVSLVAFNGFKPAYSGFFPQYLILLLKTPFLIYHIFREHNRLKKIIEEYKIDIVISDNRFGLWNRKVKTVYVTHMPRIPLPKALRFIEIAGILMHREIIKRYNFCFIPDLPGELNISGRLSHGMKLPGNVRFTGIMSRFLLHVSPAESPLGSKHNTVILSGPEPQRGILKKRLAAILKGQEITTVMLEGRVDKYREVIKDENILYYSHLPASEMQPMITESESIIARSGYTSVMDLISLNCSALLIPTPGQTEQEYLAVYLSEKGWFDTVNQNKLKEEIHIPLRRTLPLSEIIEESDLLLTKALRELLKEADKENLQGESSL
jgi:UDP-N-acetylglucosamine transferase subunit ALG13